MNVRRQYTHETRGEREVRQRGDFRRVESELSQTLPPINPLAPWMKLVHGFLGKGERLHRRADPEEHMVWLLDSTAYQASHLAIPGSVKGMNKLPRAEPAWYAEVVACIFERQGGEDMGRVVALIADMVGVDGKMGMDDWQTRRRIAERLRPFLTTAAPARFISLDIPISRKNVHKLRLRPTNRHGIISHAIPVAQLSENIPDGTVIQPSLRHWPQEVTMDLGFAEPEGWAVISDVDDTIKHTMTADAIGILRSTFVDDPTPIDGMPQLYYHIHKQLNPTWFYLSASPYNLYPFLRPFIHDTYPQGTLLLRENSWMDLAGLLRSFTTGTQAYKVGRMERTHKWLPKRKVLLIGDSTQTDPEAYAEMYRKQRGWIHAIFIRKVTNIRNMEEKNKEERFRKAFRGVPSRVWKVFERPEELYALIDELRFGNTVAPSAQFSLPRLFP